MSVPQLRFKQFEKNWDSIKIGNVFSIFNGYAFSSSKAVDIGVLWVKIADVGFQKMKRNNLSYLPSEFKQLHKKFLLKKGDYVIALTRPVLNRKLKIAEIDDFFNDSLLNQRVGKLETKNCLKFVVALLQREALIKEIENNIAGSDPPNLSPAEIKDIKIKLPSLPEQEKIANFLTVIDQKLNLLKEKKEKLELYKKGLMQQIFSQKLRFKDEKGNEFPEWEERRLAEIADKKSSNISANKIEENFGEYIIYGASGVLKQIDFYREENDYVSIIKDGAGVGRLLYCKGKSSVLGTMEIIRPKKALNTYFLYCLLSNIDFVKYITGSTIPHIYFKDYSHEICGLPSLQEQEKIANFLRALDTKINLVSTQIEKKELWKKGLLQQMFV